jgi:hypothetical protein
MREYQRRWAVKDLTERVVRVRELLSFGESICQLTSQEHYAAVGARDDDGFNIFMSIVRVLVTISLPSSGFFLSRYNRVTYHYQSSAASISFRCC